MTNWTKTWLRADDVTCVRCRRFCGPEGAVVYRYEGEGLVCDECQQFDGTVGPNPHISSELEQRREVSDDSSRSVGG